LGRRPLNLLDLAADDALDCPEEAAPAPGRLEQLADQEGRRGLAVRPRDPDDRELRGRVVVQRRCDRRHRGPGILDLRLRHAHVQLPLDDQRRSAALDRCLREVVTVAALAPDAEEEGAGARPAAVVGEIGDLDRPVAAQLRGDARCPDQLTKLYPDAILGFGPCATTTPTTRSTGTTTTSRR